MPLLNPEAINYRPADSRQTRHDEYAPGGPTMHRARPSDTSPVVNLWNGYPSHRVPPAAAFLPPRPTSQVPIVVRGGGFVQRLPQSISDVYAQAYLATQRRLTGQQTGSNNGGAAY